MSVDCESVAQSIYAETPVEIRKTHAVMSADRIRFIVARKIGGRNLIDIDKVTRAYLALIAKYKPKRLTRKSQGRFDWATHQLRT